MFYEDSGCPGDDYVTAAYISLSRDNPTFVRISTGTWIHSTGLKSTNTSNKKVLAKRQDDQSDGHTGSRTFTGS